MIIKTYFLNPAEKHISIQSRKLLELLLNGEEAVQTIFLRFYNTKKNKTAKQEKYVE